MKIWRVLGPLTDWFTEPYRKWIYRLAYKRAIKKWPDLREEILYYADWHEFLEDL